MAKSKSKSKPRPDGVIRTERDLDAAVDKVPIKKLREFVARVAALWFVDMDDKGNDCLNFNKDLGSDHLEAVTQELCSIGLYPSEKEIIYEAPEDPPEEEVA